MGSGGAVLSAVGGLRASICLLLLAAAVALFPSSYRYPGPAIAPIIVATAFFALLSCAVVCPGAVEDAVEGLWYGAAQRPRVPSGPEAVPADLPELVSEDGGEAAYGAGGPGRPASHPIRRRRRGAKTGGDGGDVGPPPDVADAPSPPQAVVRAPQPARGDGELAYHSQLGLVPHSVAERWSELEEYQARTAPTGGRARRVRPRQRVHVAL